MKNLINLHVADNIALALDTIAAGTPLADGHVANVTIPAMHKIAIRRIGKGELIRKYGYPIGEASTEIFAGDHVHTHNCSMIAACTNPDEGTRTPAVNLLPTAEQATFQGYRRPDGRVGTRNFIGIVTSVNCSATVARQIAEQVNRSGLLDAYPGVDGVVALTHGTGCPPLPAPRTGCPPPRPL